MQKLRLMLMQKLQEEATKNGLRNNNDKKKCQDAGVEPVPGQINEQNGRKLHATIDGMTPASLSIPTPLGIMVF